MLFKGKARLAGAKCMIERFDLECPPFRWEPTYPIPATFIQLDRVQEIEETGDHLHLPIITNLMKVKFHWLVSFKNKKWFTTNASLKQAILNNIGKVSFKVLFPHHAKTK
jgi:hypothetical protein